MKIEIASSAETYTHKRFNISLEIHHEEMDDIVEIDGELYIHITDGGEIIEFEPSDFPGSFAEEFYDEHWEEIEDFLRENF